MDKSNMSFADRYRYAGEDWADKESAASLLEGLRSSLLAQKCAALGDMAVNKAEQMVKKSQEWIEYNEKTIQARKAANLAKIELEALKMQFNEHQSEQANRRAEIRLT